MRLRLEGMNKMPRLNGFARILSLDFEDASEESRGFPIGSFPERPTQSDCDRYCFEKGERLFDMDDALRLHHFVKDAHQAEAPLGLAVHCYAGMSRSAAVALHFSKLLNVPIDAQNPTENANRHVLRLLEKVNSKKQ